MCPKGKAMSRERERWLSTEERLLLYQRVGVQILAPSAGEGAQWLKTLSPIVGNPGSNPGTNMMAVTPVPDNVIPSSGLSRHCMYIINTRQK